MNWYFYWYYTIYSLYKRFSYDIHFDVFATGLFSVLVSFLITGTLSFIFIIITNTNPLFTSIVPIFTIFGIVFIFNYSLFLPKTRQLLLFKKYKEIQHILKDIFVIILSFISLCLLFSVLLLGKDYFEG